MARLLKEMIVIALGIVAVIYLANPTAGFIELLPDNMPLIGNLDEAGALILLMNVLSYYGIDITNVWRRSAPEAKALPDPNKHDPIA